MASKIQTIYKVCMQIKKDTLFKIDISLRLFSIFEILF